MASGPITLWQIDGGKVETVTDFVFLGSKITVDGDCSHKIKRCFILRRKAMTNLDSVLKNRDITLPTKVHIIISCSVVPFSSCPQSFPASGSFPMSQLFTSDGKNIGASASASVLPMNIQALISCKIDWFDLLAVQGTLNSLLQHRSSKESLLQCSAFFMVQLSHPYMTTGKTIRI